MEPKPYPQTDKAEQESRAILESLIDSQFVKANINIRDKQPNIDGTFEIVNETLLPIGKFEVQLRTIGHNQTKYSCELSLVAYSEKTTLPVLLICVDSSNKRAFWKHIHPLMPGVKPTQQTFTIEFSAPSDVIDDTLVYLQKWRDIALDYQERIAKYPELRVGAATGLQIEKLGTSDCEKFQCYIDTINNLLDNDFIVVKQLTHPGVWKLGVGVYPANDGGYLYQIYRIPYGESQPLVCKMQRESFSHHDGNPYTISIHSSSGEYLANPEEAGSRFVFEELSEIVEQRALPVHGRMIPADVIIAFIDKYHLCLGISPEKDYFSVAELNQAMNKYLFEMCSNFAAMANQGDRVIHYIDLDNLYDNLTRGKNTPHTRSHTPFQFIIASERFPVKLAFQSLEYLLANQIKEIERPFARRNRDLIQGANWIWSGYTPESEIRSVKRILECSIEEYSAFVQGNHLRFPSSGYLDSDTSIIYEYEPAGSRKHEGPGIKEHHINNTRKTLPKLIVKTGEESPLIDTSRFPVISIDGTDYSSCSSSSGEASDFFQDTPVLNQIYRMLASDLNLHYGEAGLHIMR
jgi:hypothetical protein